MNHVTATLLLVPSLCFALGAEDTAFYGIQSGGGLVKLSLVEPPPKELTGKWVYGSPSHPSLRYCWIKRIGEVPSKLLCVSKMVVGPPTVIYEVVQRVEGVGRVPVAEYRNIARRANLGSGKRRGDGTLKLIYECREGCSNDVPPRLYDVATYD